MHSFRPPDELIKAHKKGTNTLKSSKLVLCLAPQLCHSLRRAREELHDFTPQIHVKLLLSYKQPIQMRIENDTQENVPL
jgi:hypothetical protein